MSKSRLNTMINTFGFATLYFDFYVDILGHVNSSLQSEIEAEQNTVTWLFVAWRSTLRILSLVCLVGANFVKLHILSTKH